MLKISFAVMLLLTLGCRATKPVPTFGGGSEHLYAHQWQLVEIGGQPVTPMNTERDAHLLFTAPDRLGGSTGCNRLRGTFALSGGNEIRFSPMATTKMRCPNDSDLENRFINALSRIATYRVDDNVLWLNDGQTTVARLQAKPANQPK